MSHKALPWSRPFPPAQSSPTKAMTAMPWSAPSKRLAPRPLSRRGATAIPNAKWTGIDTRRETSSNDFSIASSSSVVSQPDTTNWPIDSTPFCISLAPIFGYCERALTIAKIYSMNVLWEMHGFMQIAFSKVLSDTA